MIWPKQSFARVKQWVSKPGCIVNMQTSPVVLPSWGSSACWKQRSAIYLQGKVRWCEILMLLSQRKVLCPFFWMKVTFVACCKKNLKLTRGHSVSNPACVHLPHVPKISVAIGVCCTAVRNLKQFYNSVSSDVSLLLKTKLC